MQAKKPRPKKCKHCGHKFQPERLFQQCCTVDCAVKYTRLQADKKRDKEHKRRKREFRENDKSTQRKSAQRAFNAYIRARDAGKGCISCEKGATWAGQWHAGHFKTVGARPDLRFNEHNCHKQCSECNNFHSGNLLSYQANLVRRIGKKEAEKLNQDYGKKNYTAEDYRQIAQHYRQKLKELKSE